LVQGSKREGHRAPEKEQFNEKILSSFIRTNQPEKKVRDLVRVLSGISFTGIWTTEWPEF